MPAIEIPTFRGEQPSVSDRLLDPPFATKASNCRVDKGYLEPAVKEVPFGSTVLTDGTSRMELVDGQLMSVTGNDCMVPPKGSLDDNDQFFYVHNGEPRVTKLGEIRSVASPIGKGFRLGLPAPTGSIWGLPENAVWVPPSSDGAIAGHWNAPDDDDRYNDETIYYVYTFVNAYGHESAPSLPGPAIESTDPKQPIILLFTTAAFTEASNLVGGAYGVTHLRVYRLATSSESAEYLHLVDIPAPFNTANQVLIKHHGVIPKGYSDDVYIDSKDTSLLGAPLVTSGYDAPPVNGIAGMFKSSQGVLFLWDSNGKIYPSETFLPFAFPVTNRFEVNGKIRGMAEISSGILVLTDRRPFIITGHEPANYVVTEIDAAYGCYGDAADTHARHIVNMGDVVVYASRQGLVSLSASGAQVISKNLFTEEQFASYLNADFHAVRYRDAYLAFYKQSDVELGSFLFDPAQQDVIFTDYVAKAATYDLPDNQLLILPPDGSNKPQIIPSDRLFVRDSWDVSRAADTHEYTWRSKRFVGPEISFSCLKVEGFGFANNPVTVEYIIDQQKFTHTVTDPSGQGAEVFRLPAWRGRSVQIQLTGRAVIERVAVATSPEEL